ncbi:GDSL family lipase [Lachnospiraceae bacterium oral taxon 500]|nr:GDSL family lipase [Lachnospiraceae bacterium oral taxon 500]
MKIICLGDSLTSGNVGYSYIPFLGKEIQAVNQGRDGDTVRGVYGRLKKMFDNPQYNAVYILGIGTNDILLPYLRSLSPLWFLPMSLRCWIKKCTEEDTEFYQEYDRLLKCLCRENKKVIIFGLPFINLQNFPQGRLIKRNGMIKELAEKYESPFIDIYQLQKEQMDRDRRVYNWKYGFLFRVADAVIMTVLPFSKDWFAQIRGLKVSVDGVHFNSKSAKILAKEIEKNIAAG